MVRRATNGSALGGLLLIQTSESLIAEDNFENFNGRQKDGSSPQDTLSYGMKSDPGQGTNNNTILLHDKGKDNSVWYDASLPNQDGPIVIGGDVFPIDHKSVGVCYGILDSGPIRMFGTHFDVSAIRTEPTCVMA